MNLGVFNLLPVPGLDGGKLVFLAVEGVIRKPIPSKIEENATVIGVTLLIILGIVIAFKDTFMMIFG
jgi:regulator of sigma E protease